MASSIVNIPKINESPSVICDKMELYPRNLEPATGCRGNVIYLGAGN
jgi:hypothetical protein